MSEPSLHQEDAPPAPPSSTPHEFAKVAEGFAREDLKQQRSALLRGRRSGVICRLRSPYHNGYLLSPACRNTYARITYAASS